jgi:hypothetical protein
MNEEERVANMETIKEKYFKFLKDRKEKRKKAINDLALEIVENLKNKLNAEKDPWEAKDEIVLFRGLEKDVYKLKPIFDEISQLKTEIQKTHNEFLLIAPKPEEETFENDES